MSDEKIRIRELIGGDRTAEALKLLEQGPPPWRRTAPLLRSRLQSSEKDFHRGVLTREAYQAEQNRIKEAILHVIEGEKMPPAGKKKRPWWILALFLLLLVLFLIFRKDIFPLHAPPDPIGPTHRAAALATTPQETGPKLVFRDLSLLNDQLPREKPKMPEGSPLTEQRPLPDQQIRFTLANPHEEGLFLLDRLEIGVRRVLPYRTTRFPDKYMQDLQTAQASVTLYQCAVELEPRPGRYPVQLSACIGREGTTSGLFKYAPGDIDAFAVKLSTPRGFLYELENRIQYVDLKSGEEPEEQISSPYTIAAAESVSLSKLLKEAERIDWLLLSPSLGMRFAPHDERYRLVTAAGTYLPPDPYTRKEAEPIPPGEEPPINFRQVPEEELSSEGLIHRDPLTGQEHFEFFLLDRKTLVVRTSKYFGWVRKEPELVNLYQEYFDRFFL